MYGNKVFGIFKQSLWKVLVSRRYRDSLCRTATAENAGSLFYQANIIFRKGACSRNLTNASVPKFRWNSIISVIWNETWMDGRCARSAIEFQNHWNIVNNCLLHRVLRTLQSKKIIINNLHYVIIVSTENRQRRTSNWNCNLSPLKILVCFILQTTQGKQTGKPRFNIKYQIWYLNTSFARYYLFAFQSFPRILTNTIIVIIYLFSE